MPTGGFSTQNASIAAYSNPVIHYIIIFFMFVAGVNFTLHFRAITGNYKSYFKDYEFKVYFSKRWLVEKIFNEHNLNCNPSRVFRKRLG